MAETDLLEIARWAQIVFSEKMADDGVYLHQGPRRNVATLIREIRRLRRENETLKQDTVSAVCAAGKTFTALCQEAVGMGIEEARRNIAENAWREKKCGECGQCEPTEHERLKCHKRWGMGTWRIILSFTTPACPAFKEKGGEL